MFEVIDIQELKDAGLSAPFQGRALSHWLNISDGRNYPLKKRFRPQLFPNFLPQFAVIKLGENFEKHETRLMGTAVMEILGISHSKNHILATQNPYLSNILKEMLQDTIKNAQPCYYRMTHDFDRRLTAFNFTALALPFSLTEDNDTFDIIVIAFDFSESMDIKHLDNMTHPLYVPSNRPTVI
jgi:hypothetical protein